ncbi:hypothetical protein LTR99_003282 [Exophiala xenobiotica]|uniref:DUF7918 domain-containing protein n=1 Tax=Vermiconidia calcicola TaxID=1690605 RepID=A0AAV9QCS5_9PEZI|nr:hypothetical protein LTR72_009059 [Exophiala xenobiotica]KAK5538949.1 hypothetical protein LTR25_004493 [Vermiconidia calcicola]KAK5540481.1 hypothetical protein LTR23_006163 [Chaetothyriales sp. CCFEE 6169]KAK5242037.1 hypothetical protein LTS06_011773 [Exophiala xenobiotica]KAK5281111.1 hypothetical protein LTR40_005362 [Exophiala xenobiotica]
MAVLGKLEVTISSQGRKLQEYNVDTDEGASILKDSAAQQDATIIKYIEATPRAEFQINYKVTGKLDFGEADHISFHTSIDGQRIRSPYVRREEFDKRDSQAFTRTGSLRCDDAVWKQHPFCWKELSIIEETSTTSRADDAERHAHIGTIKVKVRRRRTTNYHCKVSSVALTNEPVPETALKGRAVDVGTELGQGRPAEPGHVRKGKSVDKRPLAEFIFLYRSKHALQILEVLPQTPPPPPLEDKATEALTLEEARTLLDRQKAELEAARLAIERLEEKKPKLEENVGTLWPSVAPTVALPKGHHEEDATVNSIVKREAPDQSDVNESLRSTEPPKKRVKQEPEVIYLSD